MKLGMNGTLGLALEPIVEALSFTVLGQALWQWAATILTVLIVIAVLSRIRRRAARPPAAKGLLGDVEAAVISLNRACIFGIAVFIGTRWLELSPSAARFFLSVATICLGVQIALSSVVIVRRMLVRYLSPVQDVTDASLGVLGTVAEVVIWSVIGLMMLSNLGINVSGLVASLGVGGIAVALAAQNILGDLFASLSIVIDRPFEPGDFIKVGNELGVVRKVGLKTTRVIALQGEELVFSNTDLLGSRIQNFKKMRERRVVLEVGVVYSTSVEELQVVRDLMKEAIEAAEGARFDRAHFRNFGESALMFEGVYYVNTNDFTAYMDVQQAINLKLLTELRARDIVIAFPTRTLHVETVPPALAPVRMAS